MIGRFPNREEGMFEMYLKCVITRQILFATEAYECELVGNFMMAVNWYSSRDRERYHRTKHKIELRKIRAPRKNRNRNANHHN